VIVAGNRLGALSHARLTAEAVVASGLRCVGVILNDAAPDAASESNAELIGGWIPVPLLARVPHGAAALDPALVQAWAAGR
jgi:dethiobiotin synthetase